MCLLVPRAWRQLPAVVGKAAKGSEVAMQNQYRVAILLGVLVSPILFAAHSFIYSQSFQFKRGQAIYVFAARDSQLFTFNPNQKEVRLPSGETFKTPGLAKVQNPLTKGDRPLAEYAVEYRMELYIYDNPFDTNANTGINPMASMGNAPVESTRVFLPTPASAAAERIPDPRIIPSHDELDRIAPDPEIKSAIEKEFLKIKKYQIVDSPAKADLVFLAEGVYWPRAKMEPQNGPPTAARYDAEADLLEAVFAVVIPAASFNASAIQGSALMKVRLWEGSSLWHSRSFSISESMPGRGSRHGYLTLASPESVVAQFHKNERKPSTEFPLCAASAKTLRVAGAVPSNVPINKEPKAIPEKVSPAPPKYPTAEIQPSVTNTTPVMAYVNVTDKEGKFISGLNESNFRVFEGDVEQNIDHVIPEAEPIDVALMVDASFSVSYNFDDMVWRSVETKNAALGFVNALRPEDRLMIVSFYDRIFVHSEFTTDRFQLSRALSLIQKGEGTRLYDALALILEDQLKAILGRKAIVLVTDGADTRSRITGASDTLADIDKSNVLVYAIQYVSRKEANLQPTTGGAFGIVLPEDARNNTELYQRIDKFLFSLCNNSGGLLYVAQTGSDLSKIYAGIAEQLRHQYAICFNRSNAKEDGAVHSIRVEVDHPGAKVRARTGYRSFLLPPKKNAGGH
jgi:Ca-activated chloride channel homolog